MAKKKKFKLKPAEFGEAVSLGISIVLVLGLVLYLLYSMLQKETEYLSVTATAEAAVRVEDTDAYVIPVTVENKTPKSVTYLQLSATLGRGGEERDIELDYLPRHSTRKIYLFVDRPYEGEQVEIKPLYYKFD